MKVVAWYLPGFKSPRTDMRRIRRRAPSSRRPDRQGFDSFALDIEANEVKPVSRRNAALLRLSRAIRREGRPGLRARRDRARPALDLARECAVAALFPLRRDGRATFDVFLPMAYSTPQPSQRRPPRLRLHGSERALRATGNRTTRARDRRRHERHEPLRAGGRRTGRTPTAGAVGASLYKFPALRQRIMGCAGRLLDFPTPVIRRTIAMCPSVSPSRSAEPFTTPGAGFPTRIRRRRTRRPKRKVCPPLRARGRDEPGELPRLRRPPTSRACATGCCGT